MMITRVVASLTGIALAGTILVTAMPDAVAAAKKPVSTTQKSATTTVKPSALKKEPQPVLSAEVRKSIEEAAQKLDPDSRSSLNQLSEALHLEDRAIYNELRDDEEGSVSDIGMLWQAAVEHSGTIRFAIEKLSRRDATGKPVDNDSFSKRMVQNLVHLGGVAGSMWTGNASGLIGSNMIETLMAGNPQDSALSHVTDADMVILAKDVESLQSQLITLYYDYRNAKERVTLAQEASSTISQYYDHASRMQDSNGEALQYLMQSIYDSSKQDEQNAKQAYTSARTALALMVGPEAMTALEQQQGKTKASAAEADTNAQ